MSESDSSKILQPGQRIKPNVSTDQAKDLIKQNYGFEVTKIKELNSYDDNNYYIEAINPNGNEEKCIFKVLNSMDSKNVGHVEAENACMIYLGAKGIQCPCPVQNLRGDTFSVISIPSNIRQPDSENNDLANNSRSHAIRLLKFVEGKLLCQAKVTEKLLYDTGSYIAQLGNHFKGFTHPGLTTNHNSLWKLSSLPQLLQFVFVFQDKPTKLKLVEEVVHAFKTRVEPIYGKLEKGIMHGDLNEQNILIQEVEGSKEDHTIHGVIDFGDLQENYYVFELATSTAYLALMCLETQIDPLVGSSFLLKGYGKYRPIPKLELDVLRICIAGRLCQSVVMGAYTYSQDPGNEYLLTTAKTGWDLLHRIWDGTTDEKLQAIWNS